MVLLQTLSIIAYSWLILLAIQFVGAIYLLGLVDIKQPDGGWAWGRIFWWLSASLVIWNLGYGGMGVNTQIGIEGLCIVSAVGALAVGWKFRNKIREKFAKQWKWWLLEEFLFGAGFVALSFIRAYKPDILDLEKFMDYGFMQSYLKSPTLPAADMWYAGSAINYYSFGHFMGSIMTRVWHIDLVYSYNLLLGLILGLGMIQSFSVVTALLNKGDKLGKGAVIGGIIGAVLVNIGGNSHTIWYLLSKGSFSGYWYADATRFIHNTIHEFPSYSYVVSDLHGHVWGLPIVLTFLAVFMGWIKAFEQGRYLKISVLMGILVGVMAMTNTWDAMVYGMMLSIFGLMSLSMNKEKIRFIFFKLSISAAVMGLVAFIVVFNWWSGFSSIAEGIRLVSQRSQLWEMVALWAGHVTLTTMAVILARLTLKSHKPNQIGIYCLAATAIALLIIPELIYFKDIYPNHPRANTMFKLTYQSFIIMGILGGWLVGSIGLIKVRLINRVLIGISVFIIIASLLPFPFFAYKNYYSQFNKLTGLDGSNWIFEQYPADYELVSFMKQSIKNREVIVEAVGESYTTFGRVSVFTGMPTILGWRVHEWLWRGGFDGPAARTEEVKTIYEEPTSKQSSELLTHYQVAYIVLGAKEREIYNINETGLESLGKVIFRQGDSELIRVDY